MCRVWFRLAVASLLALLAASAGAAKPLVFCADAGPEGFDPALWDSASTSNVTSQIFQGLVGFVRGGTALEPQLATRLADRARREDLHLQLRRGVKFHSTP